MAFPAVASVTASQQATNNTTSTVTLPGTFSAGDLFIALIAADSGAGAFTWPGGWTPLIDSQAVTGISLTVGYRIAQVGDTAPGVTHTTERSNHLLLRITGWHGTTPPEISTLATGSSVNPNSPSLTPSWGSADTLWVTAAFNDDSAAPTYTGYPYADNNNENGTASSAGRLAIATTTSTATSVDPGNFTLSGTETWGAVTIAVRPSGGSTVTGVASLTGDATLGAVGSVTLSGAAALSAAATLAAAGGLTILGSSSLSGDATLAAAGTIVIAGGTVTAVASLSALATLAATGSLILGAAATLDGSATLGSTGGVVRGAAASLTGNADVAAAAGLILGAIASLSGDATVASAGRLTLGGVATLDGTATLAPSASMTYQSATSLTAGADLTAVGSTGSDPASGPPAVGTMLLLKIGR